MFTEYAMHNIPYGKYVLTQRYHYKLKWVSQDR